MGSTAKSPIPDAKDGDAGNGIFLFWILVLTLVGAVLRVRYLDIQIIGGDEVHLLRVLAEKSLGEIPSTVTDYDFSIPLALFFEYLGELLPLNERVLRAPVLLFGVALPPLLALAAARRFVSDQAALLLGMVVTVHPLFIFYSRFMRPYTICLLLVLTMLYALDRWHDRRKVVLLGVAVLAGALASWFQLLALITAGLILLGALLRELLDPGDGPRRSGALSIMLAGVCCLSLTALLFAPAIGGIVEHVIEGKVGQGQLTVEVVKRNARVLVGLPGSTPYLVGMVLLLIGVCFAILRWRTRSLLLLTPLAGLPTAILVLDPELLQHAFVLGRYLFNVLPVGLLLVCWPVAQALGWLSRRAGLRRIEWTVPALAAALCALVLFVGPYRTIYTRHNAFAHHNDYQTFEHLAESELRAAHDGSEDAHVHVFYTSITDEVPLVCEWPSALGFGGSRYHLVQEHHRRPVKVVARDGFLVSSELALENIVNLGDAEPAPLPTGALLILHKSPKRERMYRRTYGPIPGALPIKAPRAYADLVEYLDFRCGRPVFDDALLRVYREP